MYKTQPYSPTNSNGQDFKIKAQNLLIKIQGTHLQLEQNKFIKLKDFLKQISNIQNTINRQINIKKKNYQNLLNQIHQLNHQLQQQQYKCKKIQMYINNRLQHFTKTNQKAFQKLKNDRQITQQRLQSYLNDKLEHLLKKSTNILYKASTYKTHQIQFTQYKYQLQQIKQQIDKFFNNLQQQQHKIKKQISTIILQCSSILQQQHLQSIQIDLLEYMNLIYLQIIAKIHKLNHQRNSMETDVLTLLQKICNVTISSATSTFI